MIHTRTFGKYQVKVNDKTLQTNIIYVWSKKDVEVFKRDLKPYEALCCLRDYYLDRKSTTYFEAKEFLMTFIEKEF